MGSYWNSYLHRGPLRDHATLQHAYSDHKLGDAGLMCAALPTAKMEFWIAHTFSYMSVALPEGKYFDWC